jgi:hypothetical protein
MARAVLNSTLRWAVSLVLAVLFVAPARGADQTACSSKRLDREIQTLQQQMTEGAFYKELLLRFGKPLKCSVDVQNGTTSLIYTFRHGAHLIAKTNPKIEFSEQRMELVHIDPIKAIALLKQAELDTYRPSGCGISWASREEESSAGAVGTRETIYWGDTCNCQARLIYKENYVVALVLRSAC